MTWNWSWAGIESLCRLITWPILSVELNRGKCQQCVSVGPVLPTVYIITLNEFSILSSGTAESSKLDFELDTDFIYWDYQIYETARAIMFYSGHFSNETKTFIYIWNMWYIIILCTYYTEGGQSCNLSYTTRWSVRVASFQQNCKLHFLKQTVKNIARANMLHFFNW